MSVCVCVFIPPAGNNNKMRGKNGSPKRVWWRRICTVKAGDEKGKENTWPSRDGEGESKVGKEREWVSEWDQAKTKAANNLTFHFSALQIIATTLAYSFAYLLFPTTFSGYLKMHFCHCSSKPLFVDLFVWRSRKLNLSCRSCFWSMSMLWMMWMGPNGVIDWSLSVDKLKTGGDRFCWLGK